MKADTLNKLKDVGKRLKIKGLEESHAISTPADRLWAEWHVPVLYIQCGSIIVLQEEIFVHVFSGFNCLQAI